MIDDDDSFAIDANGKRILIGLTAEETREFLRLDGVIGGGPPAGFLRENWNGPDDRRWLELYDKHEAARRPFLQASKTMH
jgi:hypothetical protein